MDNNYDDMKKRFAGLMDPQMPKQQNLQDMSSAERLAGAQRGASGEGMTFGAPVPKAQPKESVIYPNIVNQNESDLIKAAQQKLLQGIQPIAQQDTAEGQRNDKLDWLENAAQFDDQDAKDQLQKLAPDRFQKLFGK